MITLPLTGIVVSLFSIGVLNCLTKCRYDEDPFHLAILLVITAVHALMGFHFSVKKIGVERKRLRAICLASLFITDLLIATIVVFGLA